VSDVSAPATGLRRSARLLRGAFVYELRRQSAFRAGFVVREVLRGVVGPALMVFVFHAIYTRDGVAAMRGWTFPELVRYLILVATFEKLLFHLRGLDLSDQIFEGYVTKYLVMPLRYFSLALGRFTQYVTVQLVTASGLWIAGFLLLPQWWPRPASPAAAAQALLLILLGSYCYFLTYFLVNAMAFWLEVVWTLLVMTGFVLTFVSGTLLPVSIMPGPVRATFAWLFPYWALSAPIEIYLGRLGSDAFLRGLGVLAGSVVALELLRRLVWERGRRRYTGGGM
jgi:ABC-2 type transport system permease protein